MTMRGSRCCGEIKITPQAHRETAESVARIILVDLCDSQDVRDSYAQSASIDELIQRLAGVLIVNSRGV